MKNIIWLTTLLFCFSASSISGKEATVSLEVIDPYLEIHTGPGVGYPVIYTVEQGEYIEVLTRRPDWYEIKSKSSHIGWVQATQIARTLQPTGEPVDLPSVSYGDYLKNSLSVGFDVGEFSNGELSGAKTFSVSTAQRWASWFSTELEVGKFYESEIRGRYYGANLSFEPYSEWIISPVLTVGSGQMKVNVQPKQVPLALDGSTYTQYGIGGSYYLGRNFVIEAGYRKYTISTDQDDERLNRWHIGFNAFF